MPNKKPLKLLLVKKFHAMGNEMFEEKMEELDSLPFSVYVVNPEFIVVGEFTERRFAPDQEALERDYVKTCKQTGFERDDDVPVQYFAKQNQGRTAWQTSNPPMPEERTLGSVKIKEGDVLYSAQLVDNSTRAEERLQELYHIDTIDVITPEGYRQLKANLTPLRVERIARRMEQVRSRMSKLDPLEVRALVSAQVESSLNELLARETDLRDIGKKVRHGDYKKISTPTYKHLEDAYRDSGAVAVEDVVKTTVAQLPKTLDGKFITGYVLAQEPAGAK